MHRSWFALPGLYRSDGAIKLPAESGRISYPSANPFARNALAIATALAMPNPALSNGIGASLCYPSIKVAHISLAICKCPKARNVVTHYFRTPYALIKLIFIEETLPDRGAAR
jgi:hypothetical protein